MSHQRGVSEVKAPHSISLKVLRLSRPTLTTQVPLPEQSKDAGNHIDRRAALNCRSTETDEAFYLSPLLTLPTSFGIVHVGETLIATVCVGNDLLPEADNNPRISKVHLTAEVQTPSQKDGVVPLDLVQPDKEHGNDSKNDELTPGKTQQRILSFELREEGNHILVITASYQETYTEGDDQVTTMTEKPRTFRKLYQFSAQHLLGIRSKIQALSYGKNPYILEAQLENLGDQTVVLESITMNIRPEFKYRGLNAWDSTDKNKAEEKAQRPILRPRNILQVIFLIEPKTASPHAADREDSSPTKDGRVTLGQMRITWQGAGDRGCLNTSWLTGRRLDGY